VLLFRGSSRRVAASYRNKPRRPSERQIVGRDGEKSTAEYSRDTGHLEKYRYTLDSVRRRNRRVKRKRRKPSFSYGLGKSNFRTDRRSAVRSRLRCVIITAVYLVDCIPDSEHPKTIFTNFNTINTLFESIKHVQNVINFFVGLLRCFLDVYFENDYTINGKINKNQIAKQTTSNGRIFPSSILERTE